MRLLLDTHALLWFMLGGPQLSDAARAAMASYSNEVFVSVACIWEIATKVRIGKLPVPGNLLVDPELALSSLGFRDLQLTLRVPRSSRPYRDDRALADSTTAFACLDPPNLFHPLR